MLATVKALLKKHLLIRRDKKFNTHGIIDPARLTIDHMKNCKLLPDRYAILDQLPKGAVTAEVGVLSGDFSAHILQKTQPAKLYLIDTFESNDWVSLKTKRFQARNHFQFVKDRFKTEIENNVVVLKKGFSWDLLSRFPDAYFDWLYIDADHRYSGVRRDLEQAMGVLKKDGYLVLNDYILYSHLEQTPYGVIQAVNEFCVAHQFEFIYFAFHPQMYCDVVLRRMASQL